MNKVNKLFEWLGKMAVNGIGAIGGVVSIIFIVLLIHPVGWAILILGICKMFGVL